MGMRYGNIKYCDVADGEGVRTSLFVSGCTHHCKGCFQPETWDFSFGEEFTDDVAQRIFESVEPAYVDGITVLGGEPLEPLNQGPVADFLQEFKRRFPDKTVWVYTGDTYESLVDPASPRRTQDTDRLLALVDVLVDGPFVEELKDISARFCGSSNQRLIDLNATRASGKVTEWLGDEAFAKRGEW